jgi:hypothetical protein
MNQSVQLVECPKCILRDEHDEFPPCDLCGGAGQVTPGDSKDFECECVHPYCRERLDLKPVGLLWICGKHRAWADSDCGKRCLGVVTLMNANSREGRFSEAASDVAAYDAICWGVQNRA